ncbi:MAG TPA: 2-amino-4-hydroxy-6-hydroxymethyldihydropteridine diphosphokinase [Stellaceae bacterium]|nr:2-amino-4-hydroxy-6-hydroxymethyldihydropteridine diphosphokinase [Stellaceae bacterium]
MILIALGANLPSRAGPPAATLAAALAELETEGVRVEKVSRLYRTAPVPASDQPDYINAVAIVTTALDPKALLLLLHRIEARFGRVRGARNAARTLDLDLLDYDGSVADGRDGPVLPHLRLHERAFVLVPLAETAPDWRHPVLGLTALALAQNLPAEHGVAPF